MVESPLRDRIAADRRGVLSSLWAFVLLNMLFRDMHEFARPGAIEEFMAMDVPQGLLLASGVVLSLMISMVVLNRVLPAGLARRLNVGVALLAIAGMAGMPPGDLDDVWFAAVELVALVAVIRLAWTWPANAVATAPSPSPSVGR